MNTAPQSSVSGRSSEILGLDHLRALAAFLVFYWHGMRYAAVKVEVVPENLFLRFFEEGWVGVSLFITITGFIFTVLTSGKDIIYLRFLQNRILRLLPLIFLMTLYAIYVLPKTSRESLFLFFNLLGAGTVYGTWTLVIEFQFYLAYPFLRNGLQRATDKLPMTLIKCALLVGFFLFLRYTIYMRIGTIQEPSYKSIIGRADEFLAGIAAGLIYLRLRGTMTVPRRWIAAAVLFVSAVALGLIGGWMNAKGGYYGVGKGWLGWVFWPTIMAVLCGPIVCAYCLLTDGFRGRAMRMVAYLGTISYSTYMLHFIVLPLCSSLWRYWGSVTFVADPLWSATILVLIFYIPTQIISAVSYHLIEKPFLERKVPYLVPRPKAAEQQPAPA